MSLFNVMEELSYPMSQRPEGKRIEELASRLGTSIPGDIDARAWALPIIEVLLDRIERLEKAVYAEGD